MKLRRGSVADPVEEDLDEGRPASPEELDLDVHRDGGRLGEALVRRKLVSKGQLVEALLQQDSAGKRIGELLVELGSLDEISLAGVLADQFDFPLIDMRDIEPQPEAVALLPEAIARSLVAVPVVEDDEGLHLTVADPSPETLRRLGEAVGRPIVVAVAPASDIRRLIDQCYRALTGVNDHVAAFEAAEALRRGDVHDDAAASEDAPVVQVVNLIITQALRDRASDIHIEPQETRVRVRFRIDGALHDALALPVTMGPALVSRIKITAGMNIVEKRRAQDGQIAMTVEGRALDIRVATAATIWGEKIVMRLLDKSKPLYQLSHLGMPEHAHKAFTAMAQAPFGMVVCAGPTGSGKTTTLYAVVSEIHQSELNITTIEDPVEYVLPAINQIQINEPAGVTFASGLKAILRQDPDVILVGEVRDPETAHIAVRAALTGHVVLSSLHATDAASAIHRFIDMGVEPYLVASSLSAVVAQRLVRRNCPHCTVKYPPTADELAFWKQAGGTGRPWFHRGEGCTFCLRTGYQDRIGVFEVMQVTEEIRALLVEGGSRDQLRALAIEQGMVPLRDEGVRLVKEGVTTISEVIRGVYAI